MKNLNEYYKIAKTENLPSELDFAMLLNKINTKTEARADFNLNKNNYVEKAKSPFFAWGFGFAGFAMAAFMFFLNTNNTSDITNLAISDQVIMKSTNSTVIQNKEKVSNAINLIDSMNSFDTVNVKNN